MRMRVVVVSLLPLLVACECLNAAQPSPTTCAFENLTLAAGTKVYAAGAYAGRPLDFQIDQSGSQATQIDIAVNHPQAPVVLMLGAYDPTVWNIGWSKGTRIAAVLVGGYGRQVVAGLPPSVPTLVSTYDNKGPCGYFYVDTRHLEGIDPIAERVFHRNVDMVYPAKNGRVVVGDALNGSEMLLTAGRTPESYREPGSPLAGAAGIQDAIRKGLLRPAQATDMQAWADALANRLGRPHLPPVAGGEKPVVTGTYNTYVVLRPMTVPAGLYGGYAVTFIVPKGVARPIGNLGHSKILDFNTLDCAGVTCRDE